MRCRKCGRKAAINMRQHRLSLCPDHYIEWLPEQVQRFIKKYDMFTPADNILVAVSGGKDSLALWDILWKLGYQTEGVYIDLGIDEGINYSSHSKQVTQSFASKRDLPLLVVDMGKDYGESIPEINQRTHRGRDKPCAVCGLVKRHILNRAAVAGKFDAIVTGHNLDDEAAILLANTMEWSLEFLARGYPLLPAKPGFARKAKPLCRIYERETAVYALLRGIEFVRDECPFSVDSKQLYHKQTLNAWEDEKPGMKLRFYLKYLNALDEGAFPFVQESSEDIAKQRCPECGQPTSTGGLCTFCRLFRD